MIEIPLSVLLGVGTGLVTAVVTVFRMLLLSNERRIKATEAINASTLAHHETFVAKAQEDRAAAAATISRLDAQAQADRERYAASLEKLVVSVSSERDRLQKEMIVEVERLIREVPSLMIVQLVELGVIKTPAQAKADAAPKKPRARAGA